MTEERRAILDELDRLAANVASCDQGDRRGIEERMVELLVDLRENLERAA